MSRQSGAALLYLIAAIIVMGALAAGLAILTPSSTQTIITNNYLQRAYYLALSGQNIFDTDHSSLSYGNSSTYTIGSDSITLRYDDFTTDGYVNVYSTGTVNAGTSIEANRSIIAKHSVKSNVLTMTGETIIYDKKRKKYTVSDSSQYNNVGIVSGTTPGHAGQPVTSIKGKVGNALQFNCSQYARVVFPDISAYDIFYSGRSCCGLMLLILTTTMQALSIREIRQGDAVQAMGRF